MASFNMPLGMTARQTQQTSFYTRSCRVISAFFLPYATTQLPNITVPRMYYVRRVISLPHTLIVFSIFQSYNADSRYAVYWSHRVSSRHPNDGCPTTAKFPPIRKFIDSSDDRVICEWYYNRY